MHACRAQSLHLAGPAEGVDEEEEEEEDDEEEEEEEDERRRLKPIVVMGAYFATLSNFGTFG